MPTSSTIRPLYSTQMGTLVLRPGPRPRLGVQSLDDSAVSYKRTDLEKILSTIGLSKAGCHRVPAQRWGEIAVFTAQMTQRGMPHPSSPKLVLKKMQNLLQVSDREFLDAGLNGHKLSDETYAKLLEMGWTLGQAWQFLQTIIHTKSNSDSAFDYLSIALQALKEHTDWSSKQQSQFLCTLVEKAGGNIDSAFDYLSIALQALKKHTNWSPEQKFQFLGSLVEKAGSCTNSAFATLPTTLQALKDYTNWSFKQKLQFLCTLAEKAGSYPNSAFANLPTALQTLKDHTNWSFEQKLQFLGTLAEKAGDMIGLTFGAVTKIFPLFNQTDPHFIILSGCISQIQKRISAEVTTNVESLIPQLQHQVKELMSLPLELRMSTQSIAILPLGSGDIDRLRTLAIEITTTMDGNKRSRFRDQIHNQPSVKNIDLILEYQKRAVAQNLDHSIITQLDEILALARKIYGQDHDLGDIMKQVLSLPADIKETLALPANPDDLNLAQLGQLAISVRKTYDQLPSSVAPQVRYALVELALALDQSAYAMACPIGTDSTAQRAQKMAALVRVMYGLGYGHDGYLAVADRIEKDQADPVKLSGHLTLAMTMLNTFMQSYKESMDLYARLLDVPEAERLEFASKYYRATGVFLLGRYLEEAKAVSGVPAVTEQVLRLEAFGQIKPGDLLRPYFYGEDGFSQDKRVVGGKGWGLNWLKTRFPDNVPSGFVISAKPSDYKLSPADKELIHAQISILEKNTQKTFGADLLVAVRSGAAVSMPGAMQTVLNVRSYPELYQAIAQVYGSWDDPAALAYRKLNGIPADWGTAVNIVGMIDATSTAGFSGSGIATAQKTVFARSAVGTELVSGKNAGTETLPDDLQTQLQTMISTIEAELKYPVELEFTIEADKLYLLQLRTAKLSDQEYKNWILNHHKNSIVMTDEARQLWRAHYKKPQTMVNQETTEPSIPAQATMSDGPSVVGTLAFDQADIARIKAAGQQPIFVATDPDSHASGELALLAGAVLIAGGNPLAHLFDLSRSAGLSFVSAQFYLEKDTNGSVVSVVFGEADTQSPFTLNPTTPVTLDPANARLFGRTMPLQEGNTVEFAIT